MGASIVDRWGELGMTKNAPFQFHDAGPSPTVTPRAAAQSPNGAAVDLRWRSEVVDGLSELLRHDTDESRLFGNRWLPQMTCAMAGSSGTALPSDKATARQDETRRLEDRVLVKSKRKGRLGLIQPPSEGCTSFLI
jgi:hypothetical protein